MLAVLSKETGATLIGLMLLWDITCGRKRAATSPQSTTRRFTAYGLAAASVALMLILRTRVFQAAPWPEMLFVVNPLRGAGFLIARLTALKVIAFDLWLLLFPLSLASDRAYNQIPLVAGSDVLAWTGIALVIAQLAAAVLRYREDPILFWAAGFFGIGLLPASNLVVIIGSIMAERFLYLPSLGFAVAVTALLYRLKNQKAVPVILGCVLLLYSVRTLARNPDWNDDLTLAAADVKAAPNNFHFHASIASNLFQADQRGNIDRAIREQEAAWQILHDLPPDRQYAPTLADLGMFYRVKGDFSGGAASAEGRSWYEKSADVLARAREASQAAEKAFDASQLEHGKPLTSRNGYQLLYFFQGFTLWRLGRYNEAIEAYRYGRALDPAHPAGYDELANVQVSKSDWNGATLTLMERGFALGFSPPLLASLRDLYSRIPGGACGVKDGNPAMLNMECPKVRADVCTALAGLQRVRQSAREPLRSAPFHEMAEKQYGCSR